MTRFTYKFLLTAVVLLTSVLTCFSRDVGYKSKKCNVSYSVVQQDSIFYLVVSLNSYDYRFLPEPTMMLKTIDGEVLKLNGSIPGDLTKTTGGVSSGNGAVSTSIISSALFITTPEQFELINKGISKVRLSTMPKENEKTFKKDKIGEKIYNLYSALRDRGDDF